MVGHRFAGPRGIAVGEGVEQSRVLRDGWRVQRTIFKEWRQPTMATDPRTEQVEILAAEGMETGAV